MAVLIQASAVRSRARPGSRSPGSAVPLSRLRRRGPLSRLRRRGPLSRLRRRGRGWSSSQCCHRRAETRTTTADTTAITKTTTAISLGMTDLGSGWPCRMARWLLVHSV